MITISFGKWSHKATKSFIYERVYYKDYKWTPFCRIEKRIIKRR